jgi:CDP-L-myo-inositol myo-inositolphosphotransferase
MKVLICAAGRGSRLKHKFSPKPLTPIFGLSLLERVILNCKAVGLNDFLIVVGYKANEIIERIGNGERYGVRIQYIFNNEWEKGNGISVLKAKNYINEDENFLLIMSDHLFDKSIIEKILTFKDDGSNCYLAIDCDLRGEHFNILDATKAEVINGKVRNIGKRIKNYNAIDTGIFLCNSSIFKALEKSISEGKYSLSEGNQVLSEKGKLKTVDVTGHFWIDVDDEEALKKAKRFLLKGLSKKTDGPISKYLNRPLSLFISSKFVDHNISPNFLTIFSFLLACISGIFFSFGTVLWTILGGIMAQLSSIIDGCDGEIARLKFKTSRFGEWLDRVLDRYADGIIIIGITHGIWLHSRERWVWILGFIALTGAYLISYTAQFYDRLILKINSEQRFFRFFGRDMRLFIIFIGGLTNQLVPTLIVLAIVTNFETLRRLYKLYIFKSLIAN